MHELEEINPHRLNVMKKEKTNQEGFSYIEVMVAVAILTIGIMAQLSALSLSMLRASETEQRNVARQIASSTIESIFAARDLGNANGISNWNAINMSNVHTEGIFKPDWNPIREDSGRDGIHGTADDACDYNTQCTVGTYTNTSQVTKGFQRKIVITDIVETGIPTVRKRRIDVQIAYFVGQTPRIETLSTLIADLPFYK